MTLQDMTRLVGDYAVMASLKPELQCPLKMWAIEDAVVRKFDTLSPTARGAVRWAYGSILNEIFARHYRRTGLEPRP